MKLRLRPQFRRQIGFQRHTGLQKHTGFQPVTGFQEQSCFQEQTRLHRPTGSTKRLDGASKSSRLPWLAFVSAVTLAIVMLSLAVFPGIAFGLQIYHSETARPAHHQRRRLSRFIRYFEFAVSQDSSDTGTGIWIGAAHLKDRSIISDRR